jgi:hypothetical protein
MDFPNLRTGYFRTTSRNSPMTKMSERLVGAAVKLLWDWKTPRIVYIQPGWYWLQPLKSVRIVTSPHNPGDKGCGGIFSNVRSTYNVVECGLMGGG